MISTANPTMEASPSSPSTVTPFAISEPSSTSERALASTSAKKLSVSRLAFPFNGRRKVVPPPPSTSASPKPCIAPTSPPPRRHIDPPVRRKHTCPPSPLGDLSDTERARRSPFGSMFKPNVRYHGHSQHSMLMTKWVWSTRQSLYEGRSVEHPKESSSEDDLPKFPASTSHTNQVLLRRMRAIYVEEKRPEQAPLTMYPRQGDLAGLRDAHCARVDRTFADVRLYTLNKLVCLFAQLRPRPAREAEEGDDDDTKSEMSFNDAESTAVDSDSDWDASTTCSAMESGTNSPSEESSPDQANAVSKGNLLALAVSRATTTLLGKPDFTTSHLADIQWLCSFYKRPEFEFEQWNKREEVSRARCRCGYRRLASWAARWDLLIEVARREGVPAYKAKAQRQKTSAAKPPKEFRWLKLLGGTKGAGPKAVAAPSTTFIVSSHPATG